jgi:hypothetical protein
MSNAKIILQAKGEQNIPLNKDPQKTFFKENYRKHTIFGTDWNILSNNFNGPDDFIKPNSKYYFRIDKNGDVIKNLYLRLKLVKNKNWNKENFGSYETIFKLISNIQFMYNDRILADFDSDLIFSLLSLRYNSVEKEHLIQNICYDNAVKNSNTNYVELYLPIPLWFHKNPGLAFPLWSLNNPNVGINVILKNFNGENRKVKDVELLIDFGYLESLEKEQFTNKSLEYLIEIPQKLESSELGSLVNRKKISIDKTHFIRFMIWNIKKTSDSDNFEYYDDLLRASILFNGNALVADAHGSFYNYINRYQFFNASGSLYLGNSNGKLDRSSLNPIYSYSFSINPIDYKLSGYFTTEKYNNVSFDVEVKGRDGVNRTINIYIIKHNLMRIKDGHLSLLYN